MTFGQYIAESRKKAGLSQKDLAEQIKGSNRLRNKVQSFLEEAVLVDIIGCISTHKEGFDFRMCCFDKIIDRLAALLGHDDVQEQ